MKKIILLLAITFSSLVNSQNFWTEVNNIFSDPNIYAGEISIVDANVVWVNGTDNGYFVGGNSNYMWAKSEDAGLTWSSGMYNLPNALITGIEALSATTAYVSTYVLNPTAAFTGVYKTTNAGQTWVLQTPNLFTNPGSFVNFVKFWNENEGIAIGDPVNGIYEIYSTNNGGSSWTLLPSANIPTPYVDEYAYPGIYDVVENTMWFGTSRGRIYKSTNKGLNWTVSQAPILDFGGIQGPENRGSFAFKNETEGLIVDYNNSQWRSTDGGSTWSQEFPTGTIRNYRTVAVPQTNNTYFQFGLSDLSAIPSEARGASYTTNGGLSWIDLNTDENPIYPFGVEFQSGTVGFCIGQYNNTPINNSFISKFFRLTDPLQRLTGTSLATNNFDAKSRINLYPNPTTGLLKISGISISEITITDVLGKVVYSEKYNSLNEAIVNIGNLNNGMYLATIYSKDGSRSSQKIIKN